ncbi:hypothetical protein M409DRAFT_19500 [Zasmidium cellare ATCC 36951]|uniref:Uncharacterized protein n=1 Tax=Zasmidium cellare ATCC 36951 TaxID=1080233 RepID=A0A6A6CUG9_ZASCE|nr:uncharacterized protein M409DRAFT_19500 [Zasmidium cellare ATCC 36951]KAF2170685.1 hypothetical protein M409DRAFT_19500 [Zasmidium cellare ATCC 36951]
MAGANFMSLPPELRIRIYEYALDPLADPEAHPIFLRRKGHTEVTTGLLRANKQILAEAVEVLCSLFELRVRIAGIGGSVKAKETAAVLEPIPQYARKHMRQLLLVSANASGGITGASSRKNRPDALAGLDKYWKVISQELPQLRKLRIHINIFKSELENIKYVLWAFKGIKTLSKLRLFKLEIHQRQQSYLESAWSDRFMEDMQADLICKLMKFVEGTFEIDIQLVKKDPMMPLRQWF